MKVVAVKPGQSAEILEIKNELKPLQEFVGGYIEVVTLPDGCLLICDEEGRLKGLPNNRIVNPFGMICGNFIICESDNDGEFKSLSKKMQQKYLKIFK